MSSNYEHDIYQSSFGPAARPRCGFCRLIRWICRNLVGIFTC
jgi:hypothetical protein